MDKGLYIQCDCHTPYHFVYLEGDERNHCISICVVNEKAGPWWNKLRNVVDYLFGSSDLVVGDLVIDRKKAHEINDYITNWLKADG